VGLPWFVTIAFLRISTNRRILPTPLDPEAALGYVESWLAQPFVTPLNPGERHWHVLRRLLGATGTAGNLTNDAHLAAMAIEHDAALHSADNDFRRFPGLVYVNPLDDAVHEPPAAFEATD